MVELIGLITPKSSKQSTRESAVTQGKYNRWMTGEQNRSAGDALRADREEMRRQRDEQTARYVAAAAARKEEGRAAMLKNKIQKEQLAAQNLAAGVAIKSHADKLKQTKQRQNEEHMRRGRFRADQAEEQRQKIRAVAREEKYKVAENAAIAKQEDNVRRARRCDILCTCKRKRLRHVDTCRIPPCARSCMHHARQPRLLPGRFAWLVDFERTSHCHHLLTTSPCSPAHTPPLTLLSPPTPHSHRTSPSR